MINTNSTAVRFGYKNNRTTVTLINKQTNEEIVERSTKVRHGDKFDKRSGRKFAFTKAMKHVAAENLLGKAERTTLWNNFRTIIKQPC